MNRDQQSTYLDWGDARSFCKVSASVGAVDDALLDGLIKRNNSIINSTCF